MNMNNLKFHLIPLLFTALFCLEANAQPPLFPNSVVSNDIDFILETDPDSFLEINYLGVSVKEMPGDPNGGGLNAFAYIFEATFTDGETLEIWCHNAFGSETAAREYADKLAPRLGKLPTFQRNMVNHVVIHKGNRSAFAEIEGQFFILFSENMDDRISTNDLEETVFHESVHASYQFMYQDHPDWTGAQAADPTFVTVYGRDNSFVEDIAESALFAYAYLSYPGRLSDNIETWLEENIPNRIEFFRGFYSSASSLNEISIQPTLIASPNPTNSIFTLKTNRKLNGLLKVIDLNGTLIKSINSTNQKQIEIDLSEFENGLYIISLAGHQDVKVLKL